MKEILSLAIIAFIVYSCTGGKYGTDKIFGAPETLPLDRYEDMHVNVWFSFPDNRNDINLGKTKGTRSCRSIATDYASEQGLKYDDNWSYICCTIEEDSNCYRKIR